MLISKLHDEEVDIDLDHVALMIADQFPEWGDLSLRAVPSGGTDNAMLRLGDELVVRLPRIASAVPSLLKEVRFAPLLCPQLPAAISVPLVKGEPAHGYPWAWTVSRWLEGENPSPGQASTAALAVDLAGFVESLHSIDVGTAPLNTELRSYRGGLLATRDASTRAAIASCAGLLDVPLLEASWDTARRVAEGTGDPVWIHTDLQPGNILIKDARLAAVIDWGGLAIGDPAVDLIPAWNLLDAAGRAVFRDAVNVDDSTWERGRAWALSIGIVAFPYYVDTNPSLARVSRYQIEQVLADITRVR